MGNLEKAGVLVVVALLAVILVVAFLNFPDQSSKSAPVLGASVGKAAPTSELKTPGPKPQNVYPLDPPPDVIRPKPESDRSASEPAPRIVVQDPVLLPIMTPGSSGGGAKRDDISVRPGPGSEPKADHEKPAHDKPASGLSSGYPKTVKVQQGESLWSIAVREYGPKAGPRMLGLITDANPKVRPEAIKAGTEISLPAPSPEMVDSSTKPRKETAEKPAPPPSGTTAKAPPAPSKPARKLPFLPDGN